MLDQVVLRQPVERVLALPFCSIAVHTRVRVRICIHILLVNIDATFKVTIGVQTVLVRIVLAPGVPLRDDELGGDGQLTPGGRELARITVDNREGEPPHAVRVHVPGKVRDDLAEPCLVADDDAVL